MSNPSEVVIHAVRFDEETVGLGVLRKQAIVVDTIVNQVVRQLRKRICRGLKWRSRQANMTSCANDTRRCMRLRVSLSKHIDVLGSHGIA